MKLDDLKQLLKDPSRIFPPIALFWILEKTNQYLDFIFLIISMVFLLNYDLFITQIIVSKLNKKKTKETKIILDKKGPKDAFFHMLPYIAPKNISETITYGVNLIAVTLLNCYACWRLFYFRGNYVAIFLLITGGGALLFGFLVYLLRLAIWGRKIYSVIGKKVVRK